MAEERQGPGLPGQDIFGLPETGNRVADVLMRIAPEDGATADGTLRDDWPELCIRAAEHVQYREKEFRRKAARHSSDVSLQREYFVRAMMTAALRYRDKLLFGHGDG